MNKRVRAVGLLIKGNQILLMWRKKYGKEYYVFPGGGVEKNESVEDAVVREFYEEASIEVQTRKLKYVHNYDDGTRHEFYDCTYLSGEVALGEGNEKEEMNENDLYDPRWVDVDQVKELLVYPLEIRDLLLQDLERGFSGEVKEFNLKVKDLRQSI